MEKYLWDYPSGFKSKILGQKYLKSLLTVFVFSTKSMEPASRSPGDFTVRRADNFMGAWF
jgi:hypothetical protein